MLLYYITDRKGYAGTDSQQREALLYKVADCARAGVDYIQLREKDLPVRELERLAGDAVRATRDHSATTKLLVNSRSDVAIACNADGVHLPAGDLAATEVRTLWMRCCERQPLIGVSAHSIAEVRCARAEGADLTVVAPIFEKVKAGKTGIGPRELSAACNEALFSGGAPGSPRFVVLALGGVTVSNAQACLEAGAAGVAGIRLFQQGDVAETVRRLRQL